MAEIDQGKRFVDKAAGVARDTMKTGEAATERSIHAAQENFSMASEGVRDFNLKIIEMARANTEAFFDFARHVATTREPSALMQLFSEHTKKQIEIFSKQSQELAALGQTFANKGNADLEKFLKSSGH